MKGIHSMFGTAVAMLATGAAIVLSGCATTDTQSQAPGEKRADAAKFRADDGRIIDIGQATPANGGRSFRDPHLEKCWVADGFNFTGYDTLYIAPTASTAKFNDDEVMPHQVAKERLPLELATMIRSKGLFANVVTSEAEIKPGAKALRMENTITEYRKGGGAARYFAGLYGAGQPILRVVGAMKDNGKDVFTYEARRSGVSAGARMTGAFKTDVDIQAEDIHSMVLDLTDFMAAVGGKYQAK